jgi:hypothetical protein
VNVRILKDTVRMNCERRMGEVARALKR